MKRSLVSLFFLFAFISGFAQADTLQPPYKRFPTPPPFQVLLSDSATMYTKSQLPKNKPLLIMIFSPECSHCQHETEQIIAHKDELKDVQILMVTMHPFDQMKSFISRYQLDQLPNVVVGKDISYLLSSFYDFRNLPYMAMYDKKADLIAAFEGSRGIAEVIKLFREHR